VPSCPLLGRKTPLNHGISAQARHFFLWTYDDSITDAVSPTTENYRLEAHFRMVIGANRVTLFFLGSGGVCMPFNMGDLF
jgi:hypothetical protein